jgi:hypothetical protein
MNVSLIDFNTRIFLFSYKWLSGTKIAKANGIVVVTIIRERNTVFIRLVVPGK